MEKSYPRAFVGVGPVRGPLDPPFYVFMQEAADRPRVLWRGCHGSLAGAVNAAAREVTARRRRADRSQTKYDEALLRAAELLDPGAPSTSRGLMQVMPSTFERYRQPPARPSVLDAVISDLTKQGVALYHAVLGRDR